MSLGEDRVRIKFNPSSNDFVHRLKTQIAEFIDMCDSYAQNSGLTPEEKRLWSLAMTHAEDAAMWAVKAATS